MNDQTKPEKDDLTQPTETETIELVETELERVTGGASLKYGYKT